MKLLLVDDEFYIIEYLKHIVDWQGLGFTKIFSTTDSLEAEEILINEKIDLLITDISMPEISGIDIAQFIYEHQLKTLVVLLSGHSEFEYAQKAIRFGVREYLLKPITKEGLQEALNKILPQLDRRTQPRNLTEWWRLLFTDLEDSGPLLTDTGNSEDVFRFFRCAESSGCLIPEAAILQKQSEVVGVIQNELLDDTPSPLILSEPVTPHHISVPNVFYSFFYGVILGTIDKRLERHPYLRALRKGQVPPKSLKSCLADFDEPERIILCGKLLSYLYRAKLPELDKTLLFSLDEKVVREQIIEETERLVRNQVKVLKNREIVERTNQYIRGHLADDLSLESLASLVFLNTTYFSALYKQETGINISNFILESRLEKAVRLLKDTQLKVYDISLMVGYPNSQYFVRLFRTKFGTTPNQYRKQHGLD